MLLIWRWICFYPARPENTEENQPITNVNHEPSPTPRSPVEKSKIHQKIAFFAQIYDASGMI